MSDLPRDDTIPQSLPAFLKRFSRERACAATLRRWRWPQGFRCPACDHDRSWYIETRRLDECASCGHQTSLTAGTVMHKSTKPLTQWFLAIYLFTSSKQGISASELSRQLGVAYQTAWLWLQKLRSALGARATELLQGVVEVDETYEVGIRFGEKRGRPAVSDRAALIAGAIEVPTGRRGFGRLRLASLEAASGQALGDFIEEHVRPGSMLLTDGLTSYRTERIGASYDHVPTSVKGSGRRAHEVLPGIHRVFALLDRVLKGTYQGAVRRKHLAGYLDEFAFRFNRRNSKSRALLFQRALSAGVRRAPPTYWEIIDRENPRKAA